MSIVVKNLSKVFGTQKAVNDVSFSANKGEITGFLGPNGAGKSTTMKMITGYIPPTAGSIEVCGIQVSENAIQTKSKIGYLPEHNPLYKDMYVKEYLKFVSGLGVNRVDSKRIEEVIDLTGLNLERHKKIGALSKGYRQRVGLAQAIFHDPEVIILDEPTSGLDPNQLEEIRNLIKSLGKEKTVILSTHIMQEVQLLCDRVVIIDRGTIVANEDIDGLRKIASGSKVVELELDDKMDTKSFMEIQGVENVIAKEMSKYELWSDIDIDPRKEIFQKVVESGRFIKSMGVKQESVESVFQKLTKKDD